METYTYAYNTYDTGKYVYDTSSFGRQTDLEMSTAKYISGSACLVTNSLNMCPKHKKIIEQKKSKP